VYLVLQNTYTLLIFNTSPAGLYKSNGTSWDFIGALPAIVSDNNFKIYDSDDFTRQIAFNAGNISTLNTRILTMSNYNQDLTNPIFNSIQLNLTPTTTTPAEGLMYWNEDDGTLNIGMKGSNVNLQVGQEQLLRAQNAEGASITNGSAVRISAAASAQPRVVLINNTEEISPCTIAIATETVANNQFGFFCTNGLVRDINTSGLTEGQIVYLGATDGTLTNTIPTAPSQVIKIGYCLRQHATEGVLLVSIQSKELYRDRQITKEPTGFAEPADVIVTDNGDRTVTLTGTVNAYYRGVRNTDIVTGYTSPAHGTTTTTKYFLTYNGTNIAWRDLGAEILSFADLLICYAFYDTNNTRWVYLHETHGLMPHQSHKEFHETIGTYRTAGGTLADYVLDSTTAANRRPSVSACTVFDEDLQTINALLPANGPYTNAYLTTTGLATFNLDQNDIVPLSTNQPYYNLFTGGAWTQALMDNNQYMSIWLVAMPVCAGVNCQKYRFLWVQGQSQGTLASQNALQPQDLSLGNFATLSPEYVFITKVVIQYTAANWKLISVSDLTGNRFIQSSSPSGLFLSTVATDTTLTGDGTTGSPLSVAAISGFSKITVGTTEPVAPTTNDLWVDVN
jgi:hypothetical protein